MCVPVWRQHDGASIFQDTCQCIPEKASGNWIHTSGGFILQNTQWSILVVSYKLFAACHTRGTKPPCWDANIAQGQHQQKAYIILNGNFLFFLKIQTAGISRVQGGSLETLSRDSCSKFFSFFTRFANSWQGNHNSVKQITAGPWQSPSPVTDRPHHRSLAPVSYFFNSTVGSITCNW